MQNNSEEYATEIERLTEKCDQQLDHINEQVKLLKQKEELVQQLQYEVKNSTGLFEPETTTGRDNFTMLFKIFYQVVGEAVRNNDFFENRRVTPISRKYHTIDYKVISTGIERYTTAYSVRKIIKLWANTGLVYQDENDKVFVNVTQDSKTIRSIRINRAAVEYVKECLLND